MLSSNQRNIWPPYELFSMPYGDMMILYNYFHWIHTTSYTTVHNYTMINFSCIIPAYNEWPRIASVLSTILACTEIDEVIVIDDGSTDNTRAVIEGFAHPRLRTIFLDKNGGKTNAVLTGVKESRWWYIVMIDSDLLNLTPEHITALIDPIKNESAQVTLSLRENSLPLYRFLGTDFVSGERVLPKSLFADRDYYLSRPWFGLEVLLNTQIILSGYSVNNIYLPGVITPRKSSKIWYIRGTLADLSMTREILSIIPAHRLIHQMWYFSRFYQK